MTEHRDARELLELAAVEPAGLDRLEAGDTAEAAAVVGHLAGCPACLEELARLRRAEALLRPILADAPDPALRERTLAYVRAVGVPRDAAAGGPAAGSADEAPAEDRAAPEDGAVPEDGAALGPAPAPLHRRTRRRSPIGTGAWAASLAAVLVIGLVAGGLLVGRQVPAGNADAAVALDAVARETAALVAAGDARGVALVDATGTPLGTLVLSPTAGRIVVSAAGLPAPPTGDEYRCWVEVDGARRALGSMWMAGDVAWWAGDVALPSTLPPGVVYGVSLVEAGSPGPGAVVLTGEL
jgi:hypothetical protein